MLKHCILTQYNASSKLQDYQDTWQELDLDIYICKKQRNECF